MLHIFLVLLSLVLVPSFAHAECVCPPVARLQKALALPTGKRAAVAATLKGYEDCRCENAVDVLVATAQNGSSPYVLEALHALGSIGGEETRRLLVTCWENPYPQPGKTAPLMSESVVRLYIAGALNRAGNDTLVNIVFKAAESRNETLRYHAIKALGQVVTPRSREELWSVLLSSSTESLRCAAVDSLRELEDPKVVSYVRRQTELGLAPACFTAGQTQ